MSTITQGLIASATELARLSIIDGRCGRDQHATGDAAAPAPTTATTFMAAVEVMLRELVALSSSELLSMSNSSASSSDAFASAPLAALMHHQSATQLAASCHLLALRGTLAVQLFRFCESLEEATAIKRRRNNTINNTSTSSSDGNGDTNNGDGATGGRVVVGLPLYEHLFQRLVEDRVACLNAFLASERRSGGAAASRANHDDYRDGGEGGSSGGDTQTVTTTQLQRELYAGGGGGTQQNATQTQTQTQRAGAANASSPPSSFSSLLSALPARMQRTIPNSAHRLAVAGYVHAELSAMMGAEVLGTSSAWGGGGGGGGGGSAAAGGGGDKLLHQSNLLTSAASANVFVRDNVLLPIPRGDDDHNAHNNDHSNHPSAAADGDEETAPPPLNNYTQTQTQRYGGGATQPQQQQSSSAAADGDANSSAANAAAASAELAFSRMSRDEMVAYVGAQVERVMTGAGAAGASPTSATNLLFFPPPPNSPAMMSMSSMHPAYAPTTRSGSLLGGGGGGSLSFPPIIVPSLSAIATAFGYQHFGLILLQIEQVVRGLAMLSSLRKRGRSELGGTAAAAAAVNATRGGGGGLSMIDRLHQQAEAEARRALAADRAACSRYMRELCQRLGCGGGANAALRFPHCPPLRLCPTSFHGSVLASSAFMMAHSIGKKRRNKRKAQMLDGEGSHSDDVDDSDATDDEDANAGTGTQAPLKGSSAAAPSSAGPQRLTVDALKAFNALQPPIQRSAGFVNRDGGSETVYTDTAAYEAATRAKAAALEGGGGVNAAAAPAGLNDSLAGGGQHSSRSGVGSSSRSMGGGRSNDDADADDAVTDGKMKEKEKQRGAAQKRGAHQSDTTTAASSGYANGGANRVGGRRHEGAGGAQLVTTTTIGPNGRPIVTRRSAANYDSSAATSSTAFSRGANNRRAGTSRSNAMLMGGAGGGNNRRGGGGGPHARSSTAASKSLSRSRQRVRSVRSYASKFRHSDGRSGTTMQDYDDSVVVTLAVPEVCRYAMDSGVQVSVQHVAIPRDMLLGEVQWQLEEARRSLTLAGGTAAADAAADAHNSTFSPHMMMSGNVSGTPTGGSGVAPTIIDRLTTSTSPLRQLLLQNYKLTLPFSLDTVLDELSDREVELATFIRTARDVMEGKAAVLKKRLGGGGGGGGECPSSSADFMLKRLLAVLEAEMLSRICDTALHHQRVCSVDSRWELSVGDANKSSEVIKHSPHLQGWTAAGGRASAAPIAATESSSSLQSLRIALAAFNNSCRTAVDKVDAREGGVDADGEDGPSAADGRDDDDEVVAGLSLSDELNFVEYEDENGEIKRRMLSAEEKRARRRQFVLETDPHVVANLRFLLNTLLGPFFFNVAATPAVVNTAAAVQCLVDEAMLLMASSSSSSAPPSAPAVVAGEILPSSRAAIGGHDDAQQQQQQQSSSSAVTLSFAVVSCVACETTLSVPICLPNDPLNRRHATMPFTLQQHVLYHAASAKHRRQATHMGVEEVTKALVIPQTYAPFYSKEVNADNGRLVASKQQQQSGGGSRAASASAEGDSGGGGGLHDGGGTSYTIVHINGIAALLPVRPPQGLGHHSSNGGGGGGGGAEGAGGDGPSNVLLMSSSASAVGRALGVAPALPNSATSSAVGDANNYSHNNNNSNSNGNTTTRGSVHPLTAALRSQQQANWCGVVPKVPSAAVSPLLSANFDWRRILLSAAGGGVVDPSSSSSPSSSLLLLSSDVEVDAFAVKLIGQFARLRLAGSLAGQLQRHTWSNAGLTDAILAGLRGGSGGNATSASKREAPQSAAQHSTTNASAAPPTTNLLTSTDAPPPQSLTLEESYFRSVLNLPSGHGTARGAAAAHLGGGGGGGNFGDGDEEEEDPSANDNANSNSRASRLPAAAWSPLSALISLTVNAFAAGFAGGASVVQWLLACADGNIAAEVRRMALLHHQLPPPANVHHQHRHLQLARTHLNHYIAAQNSYGTIVTEHIDRMLFSATLSVEALRAGMQRLRPAARDTYRQRVSVQMRRAGNDTDDADGSTLFDHVMFVTLASYQDLVGDGVQHDDGDGDDGSNGADTNTTAASAAMRTNLLHRHTALMRYRHGCACLQYVVEVLGGIVREATALWESVKRRLSRLVYQLQVRQCAELGILPDVQLPHQQQQQQQQFSQSNNGSGGPSHKFYTRQHEEKLKLCTEIANLLLLTVNTMTCTFDSIGNFFRSNSAEVFAKPIHVAIPAECTIGKWGANGPREPAPSVFRLALEPLPAVAVPRGAEEEEGEGEGDEEEESDSDGDDARSVASTARGRSASSARGRSASLASPASTMDAEAMLLGEEPNEGDGVNTGGGGVADLVLGAQRAVSEGRPSEQQQQQRRKQSQKLHR